MAIWVLGMVLFVLVGGDNGGVAGHDLGTCGFPAIYNIGDNNSDTGQRAAMYADLGLPNGKTFFGRPSGRYCDGRLIIDFIAEHFGFPYLSSYLDSYRTNFRHGANFAMGGSSIRLYHSYSHFEISRQVFQFAQLKSRTTKLHQRLSAERNNSLLQSILPRPDEFSKALFTIDIGQNDFAFDFLNSTAEEARNAIPSILFDFSNGIKFAHEWYQATHFWIHNVGPVGCLPFNVKTCQKRNPGGGCVLDQNGCVKDQNEVIQEFNTQLKQNVTQLRAKYPNATFTYVDVYSAKYNLISNAKNLGFEDPMKFCCGSFDDHYILCGNLESNGTVCDDPSRYISWDGIHYTEAANQLLARQIISGSLSDPPLPIAEACRRA